MSPKEVKNIAASVHERLLVLSRKRNEDFGFLLSRYANVQLLYRLSRSEFKDRFVLKGAMLFAVWVDKPYRPTRDIDLLAFEESSTDRFQEIFETICKVDVEPDGLVFDPESIRIIQTQETQAYGGFRVKILAKLGRAVIPVQIDIGFGDAITPEAETKLLPTLLEMPPPELRVYPKETFIAEKLHTMVIHGIMNGRLRDYYDLWFMARTFVFNGVLLSEAIKNTFDRRRTDIPPETPSGLGDEYIKSKEAEWRERNYFEDSGLQLKEIVDQLRIFLIPPLEAVASGEEFIKV